VVNVVRRLTDDERDLAATCAPLAFSIALKTIHRHGLHGETADLVHDAAMDGLRRAAQAYDPSRGTKFSTAAALYVRGLIRSKQWRRMTRKRAVATVTADDGPDGLDFWQGVADERDDFGQSEAAEQRAHDLARVLAALDKLKPWERRLVRRVSGADGKGGASFAEAGAEIGTTRQQARHLYLAAVQRLRWELGVKGED
jgi:RNA polymerase sigma factor (sigma-70 family)